jgi:hypothetical protein
VSDPFFGDPPRILFEIDRGTNARDDNLLLEHFNERQDPYGDLVFAVEVLGNSKLKRKFRSDRIHDQDQRETINVPECTTKIS